MATPINFLILLCLSFTNVFAFKLRRIVKPTLLQCKIGESNNVAQSNGLLSGVYDIIKAEIYSGNISIINAYELLKDPNPFYNICLKNAGGNTTMLNENLKSMRDNAENFIQSDEVWNRKELIASIENIIDGKGKFVCILAGKNTGKSLVLRNVEKRFPAKVFAVDLRAHPDILKGLIYTLRDRKKLGAKDKTISFTVNIISDVLKMIYRVLTGDEFVKYVNIVLAKSDHKDLATVLDELVAGLGAITLVVDEANISLTISETTSEAKIDSTKQSLALFTRLTKQTNKVTIQ